MQDKDTLVTCALPYANGPIHIGHLVEYIQADIWVRYQRLRGRSMTFVCADDTHGTPIMVKARSLGISPEALIDEVWHEHRQDFEDFGVRFDHYYTTHSPENRRLAVEIYERLSEQGLIEARWIKQPFCVQDGMFLPDRFILGDCPSCGAPDQYGDICERCGQSYGVAELEAPRCAHCGSSPEWRQSEHLFFRIGDFADALERWIHGGGVDQAVARKLDEWLEAGLRDWDISRDAPYFGFEIPDRPGKFFYVWLDAPVGYMAATESWCREQGEDFDRFWRRDDATEVVHFIGKDIVYFHALFWPAMLMGAGFRVPTRLFVHGFLTVEGSKMSKTRGTLIRARDFLEHLPAETLRYYFATKLGPGINDINLNFDDFVNRVNADLVNKIVNIPSRCMAILHRSCRSRLGRLDSREGLELVASLRQRADEVADHYEARRFSKAMRAITAMADDVNGYLQSREPWIVAKKDPQRAAAICTVAINGFRIIAVLLAPVLPDVADKVAEMLGLESLSWDLLDHPLEDRQVGSFQQLATRVRRGQLAALLVATREAA